MKKLILSGCAVLAVAISGVASSISFGNSLVPFQVGTKQGSMGEYLTDSKGMSLYVFDADSQGNGKSTCYDKCAKDWPPAVVPSGSKATVSGNVKDPLMGTISRTDGTIQLTYNGLPLYYYYNDKKAGDTNGENVVGDGGLWQLVKPDGSKL